jgi:hypothetical protein
LIFLPQKGVLSLLGLLKPKSLDLKRVLDGGIDEVGGRFGGNTPRFLVEHNKINKMELPHKRR